MIQKEGMDLEHNLLIPSLQVFEISLDLFLLGVCKYRSISKFYIGFSFGQILLMAILYVEQKLCCIYYHTLYSMFRNLSLENASLHFLKYD